jgi:hypothetical protein
MGPGHTMEAMVFRNPRRKPSRSRLIDRKHEIEGQIAGLRAEVRRARNRGDDPTTLEAKLQRLQNEHYSVRLRIDRTDPGSTEND